MGEIPPEGRVAGVDYGERRIGIAICDASRILASPFENYERQVEEADRQYFQRLVAAEQLVGFVVGLPVHASGQESDQSRAVRRFAAWLRAATRLPVGFVDERYTSRQADALLRGSRLTRAKRKQRRDMLAAQVILAAFLESPHLADEAPAPLED
jgi:putative Holliday junction resolvase